MEKLITGRHAGWLIPLVVGGVLVLAGAMVEKLVRATEVRDERIAVLQELSTLRARTEGVINRNLMVLTGLAADISVSPELDQQEFSDHATALMRNNAETRHVAAARDLVVSMIHPMAGNETALGLDYLVNEQQRGAVLRARDSGEIVLAGPVNLVQGGEAIIGRAPVYLSSPGNMDGRFWGIVSGVIELDAVWRSIGLLDDDYPLSVAIRRRDGNEAHGAAFFGPDDLFAANAVTIDLTVPGGRWQVAGMPISGWNSSLTVTRLVRVTTMLVTLLAIIAIMSLRAQIRHRERAGAQVQASRRRMIDAIESISDGFALWDAHDRLVLCNSRYRELYPELSEHLKPGASFESLLRLSLRTGLFKIEGDPKRWLARGLDADKRGCRRMELTNRNDRLIQVDERRTADGGIVVVHTDITDIRRAEENIRFRAYFDPLTRLPNRANFREQLGRAVERSQRSGRHVALLFIDLDRFKNINDTLGHDVGDDLLIAAAERIRTSVRNADAVARQGGDEFTVLLEDLTDIDQATVIAETIIDQLTQPFDLNGHQVYAGASIGITMCPMDGKDAKTLLRNADMAMYHAKDMGGNTCHYFTSEMTARAQRYVAIESDLRRAIGSDQFVVFFQPIVDIGAGTVAGAEALVRWQHPTRGLVMPGEFIQVAEKSGLIVDMGLDILRTACVEAGQWPDEAARDGSFLSVNVSCRQFKSGFNAALVEEILHATGFPAERMVFEITESLLLDENALVRETMHDFKDMGINLAIDDFGTGYSSLSYLRRFPVTRLKIDRSFVAELEHNDSDARLVESIVAMAIALNVQPIAEGVETPGQAERLFATGCNLAQGYYYARPMAPGSYVQWFLDAQSAAGGDPLRAMR